MTARYNPHRIEKQARKWPVLFSAGSLEEDLKLRLNMLWNKTKQAWADPFCCKYAVNLDLLAEYGIDTVRLALISAQQKASADTLLESSFKWLARLDHLMNAAEQETFDPTPWLEAALQTYDHVMLRNNYYSGLALLRKALRSAPPGRNLPAHQRNLILSAVYPYAPLWATFNLPAELLFPTTISFTIESFEELACVRFSLPKGGWHWKVFERSSYEANPLAELLRLKWVKKAADGKIIRLESDKDGLRLCFK
ncbi:MAG: hypothetical protein ACD_39C01468G0002 [uncultured bacterium]|nr:MAG: hypothetical protein ACD_39C01468G0002 [uncultured bacterium]